MIRAWLLPASLTLVGLLGAGSRAADGSPLTGLFVLVAFLLLAFVNSPLLFPRSLTHAEALRRSAADGRPVVYWRPGCAYCMRLRTRLGSRAHRAHWVNIWRDPEAAAAVRAANDGNETVPTVLVFSPDGAETVMTNPSPAQVEQAFAT